MTRPELTHENVDDIPLLAHTLRERLKLDQAFDGLVAAHGNWQGLSKGEVLVAWLIHILSTSSHFMYHVRDWANVHSRTLAGVFGHALRETDLTDDRLAEILRWLSDDERWRALAHDVNARVVRVYQLKRNIARVDGTTASVDSHNPESVLFQFGHSKDHRPDLKQLKVMMAALDPLGLVMAAEVVPGNRADDGLYIPVIDHLLDDVQPVGMLIVGDCKMSALATRAHIRQRGQHYLSPLAQVGQVPEQMAAWVAQAVRGDVTLRPLTGPAGEPWGAGYEFSRPQSYTDDKGHTLKWNERVLVIRSETYAQAAQRGLAARLKRAEEAIAALSPPRGRGQRQFTERDALQTAAQAILDQHRVSEFLSLHICREVETQHKRAYGAQLARTTERVRYVVSSKRRTAAISAHAQTLGWRAYVTDASRKALPLRTAVQVYRDEWLIERDFRRLKGSPLSLTPLWLTRDDHAIGMVRLLTLAMRVLALVEHKARCALAAQQRELKGLVPGHPNRPLARPTTERLLQAFNHIVLTEIRRGAQVELCLTQLTAVQKDILHLLSCPLSVYTHLERCALDSS